MKKLFVLLTVCQLCMLAAIEIVPVGKKYLYKVGEEVVFKVQLDKGRENARFNVRISGGEELNKSYSAPADEKGSAEIRLSSSRPGFIYVVISDSGKTAQAGVGVEPEKIIAGRPCPEAFDRYWQDAVKRLELLPPTYQITEIKSRKGFKAYELLVSLGSEAEPLFAVMTMPEKASPGRLAAEAVFHGAGTDTIHPLYRKDTIVLSVNPMSIKHDGPPSSTIHRKEGKFYKYYHWGVNDLQKNYFPGMFKRAYRALQVLKSMPEWDHRTLIVRGGSQGGAQALVAAALDPQVTLCIACVPALCDHGGNEVNRISGWPRYFSTQEYKNDPDKAAAALDMIDVVFFARKIKTAKVFVTVGFIDRTCVPDSVYAAYNVIPSKDKSIANDFLQGHTVSPESREKLNKLISEHIEKNHEIFR